MTVAQLTEELYVSPQITVDDLPGLKARGIRSIVNNRPDHEQADQPPGEQLAAAARAQGMDYRHIPVVSGRITAEQVTAFAAALQEMPLPLLAFCRSGTRSTSLWAMTRDVTLGRDS